MQRAHVVTPWIIESSGARTAKLFEDYKGSAAGFTVVDVTGQPAVNIAPAPNAFTVEVVADDTTMNAIANDTRYSVLWQEVITDAAG